MSIMEDLHRLAVNGQSADRSLRVVLSAATGLRVEANPYRIRGHTEETLSRQVSTAVQRALEAMDRQSDRLLSEWDPPLTDPEERAGIEVRLKRFTAAVREIEVSAVSQRGLATATLRGTTRATLTLKSRCLDNFGFETVMADINGAFTRMLAAHGKRVRDARQTTLVETRPVTIPAGPKGRT